MDALKADTHRRFGRFSWGLVCKGFLLYPDFCIVVTLRCCQAAQQCPPALRWLLLFPAQVLHRLACHRAAVELPWRTRIAPGLALTHARGIVVNQGARIGSNVTLFHGVTLGQRDRIDRDGRRFTIYPVIEDDVLLGPYAVVAGVTIGRGSRIAAGAYVLEDVPPRCVVLGNPGVIVKRNCTPDVLNRWDASPPLQEGPQHATVSPCVATPDAGPVSKTADCPIHNAGTGAAAPGPAGTAIPDRSGASMPAHGEFFHPENR